MEKLTKREGAEERERDRIDRGRAQEKYQERERLKEKEHKSDIMRERMREGEIERVSKRGRDQ